MSDVCTGISSTLGKQFEMDLQGKKIERSNAAMTTSGSRKLPSLMPRKVMISNCYLQLTTDTHILKYTCMYVHGHILKISYTVALCMSLTTCTGGVSRELQVGINNKISRACVSIDMLCSNFFINMKISSDKRNSDILAHFNVWCVRQESEIAKHVQSL